MGFPIFFWAESSHGGHSWLSFLCTWSDPNGSWPERNNTHFMRSAWLLPLGGAGAKALLGSVLTGSSSRLAEPASYSHFGCPWHTAWSSHNRSRRLPPRALGQLLSLWKWEWQDRCLLPALLEKVSTCWEPWCVSECWRPVEAHHLHQLKRETKIVQNIQLEVRLEGTS